MFQQQPADASIEEDKLEMTIGTVVWLADEYHAGTRLWIKGI
jgi:hypothetical protein